ncbi:MAG: hypothetical protein IPP19_00070 [Verrucomicrobia bacterium]|nr:hypothetical protein [Verrucomicrobiota bacterium]
MHPRYDSWIKYVFDHPVTDQQWHFELEAPKFTVNDVEIATLVAETYEHAGTDLVNFSDAQVNQGLWYLSSNACSDYHMQIRDGGSSVELKSRAIRAVYNLYRDCFAKRCNETLGHTDEPGASELNPVCYMFWDITPWGYLTDLKFEKELSTAILDTLDKTLHIEH